MNTNHHHLIRTQPIEAGTVLKRNGNLCLVTAVVGPPQREAEWRRILPWNSFPSWSAIGLIIVSLLVATFVPSPAQAGSGRVNNDGTIDITLNFRFPPNAADLVNTRNQVTAASQTLWDSSEGQLRFGRVTFTCGSVNEDQADMWVFAQAGRAGVSYMFNGSGLGTPGYHVNQFLPSSDGIVLAHEFGHLALGLGDEYSEQSRFGACWGFGQCTEAGALSEQNQCLMQQPGGFTQTEFCTSGRHDLLLGDNLTCAAQPVPHGCADNCQFFNHTTGRYETSQQTANVNRSCWAHLKANFPWLNEPSGLPMAAAPAGFVAPTFIENCGASDTVMLFLDRSGSMLWNTERDNGEVCGDGADNDGDGMVDEAADCTQQRMMFVKASARAWLALANNRGVRAGIISFNEMATYDRAFQPVTDATIAGLNATVDGLVPGGDTAIGSALRQSIFPFDGEAAGVNKTAFLISDGVSNRGENPRDVVPDLRARGIRVFTISTGGASSDATLADISGTTGGAPLDSPSGTTLVNFFAQQWARYRNITIPVPLEPYTTHGENRKTTFNVVRDTPSITMIFAGNMSEMAGFGLRVILTDAGGTTFDTDISHPDLRVVRDRFFMLVEVRNMRRGAWNYQVLPAPGASIFQTGNLTVLDDNPDLDLFSSLDRHVVTDTSVPVEL
ncbi:MAG TPA: VWA domain-containing protein, partial [Verrucomicrobiae bacterium]|nr:VWA domain-containing protein [Verrucomicrobiae bacterium]